MFASRYHEATKHHFGRFARSRGHLDWATQPQPFRRYAGAPVLELPRGACAPPLDYERLYDPPQPGPTPVDASSVGEFLRCSLGLSAWKSHGSHRWALRVNPSSGNLHPTEGWVLFDDRMWHYAPDVHALESRASAPRQPVPAGCFLAALTSVLWREAWKYGERAFRYCHHDIGHALVAMRHAATLLRWRLVVLPHWSDESVAGVLGLDRLTDYADVEPEEPACMVLVGAPDAVHAHARSVDPEAFVAWSRAAVWTGHANQLSPSRVDWPIVDDVARATRRPRVTREWDVPSGVASPGRADRVSGRDARDVIIARRSALGFDGHSTLPADVFHAMLDRLLPPSPPWDAVTWSPAAQLAIFVHRVEGMTPGLYFFGRDQTVARAMRDAMRSEFLWEAVTDRLSLLVPIDCGPIAQRLSCDQDIARDGFFSLAMLVPFAQTLESDGDWGYRRLFWDCGMVGQVLYLEAEAAGARGTGIGCFYDDPVHDLLGLRDSTFQSLYHFSMGVPIEDVRLGTEPGYSWELPISSQMRRASSDPSHDR